MRLLKRDRRDRILADAVIPIPAGYPAAAIALSVAADAMGVSDTMKLYAAHKDAALRDEVAASAQIQVERLIQDWKIFHSRHAGESLATVNAAVDDDGGE